jgi:glutamate-1-semialdehyde 2,1-aminomutase
MFAIRTAKAYTGRLGVIKMLGGYHGTHDLVECSINPKLTPGQFGKKLGPLPEPGISENAMKDVYVVPYNNLDAVEEILEEHAKEIACVIVEPFMGTTGMIPAKPGYLKGLRELCDKYDVVYIIDEVQGFRLSTGGAQKKFNVDADLTTFGKIIGGGLAVGAFGGCDRIMRVFDHENEHPIQQSGTFNGNRATMAGGIASLKLLSQEKIDYIDFLGERLEKGFENEIGKRKLPISITREGSLLNIHISAEKPYDYETAFKSNKAINKLWYLEMLNRGIFPAPRGLFVISTVMTEEVIDRIIPTFAETLDVMAPFL